MIRFARSLNARDLSPSVSGNISIILVKTVCVNGFHRRKCLVSNSVHSFHTVLFRSKIRIIQQVSREYRILFYVSCEHCYDLT